MNGWTALLLAQIDAAETGAAEGTSDGGFSLDKLQQLAVGVISHRHAPLVLAMLLGTLGLWLILSPRARKRRRLGIALALASVGVLGSMVQGIGGLGEHSLFLGMAAITVVAAGATIISRNPVYAALWFALSLVGTAGLMLAQGAQFLGVATIVVYAGAILVTFLFVLMLANPAGRDFYDRISWEPLLSAGAAAALVGIFCGAIGGVLPSQGGQAPLIAARAPDEPGGVLEPEHMAVLGRELFSRHLVAVEVAGTLLLVALVGAIVITARQSENRRHRTTIDSRSSQNGHAKTGHHHEVTGTTPA